MPQKNTIFRLTSTFACYYEQLNGKTVDISEEIPFDLPESWCWCRLGSVVEICDNLRKPINAEERQKRIKSANTLFPYYGATGQVGWIDDFISDGEFVLLGEDDVAFIFEYACQKNNLTFSNIKKIDQGINIDKNTLYLLSESEVEKRLLEINNVNVFSVIDVFMDN